MAKRESKLADKIPIDMTPMIDVVFQLITFFMLTLKTVIVEGDFDIRMPLGARPDPVPPENPPVTVRVKMTAGPDGELAGISMNGSGVGDFEALRQKIIGIVGVNTGPGGAENTEVELDCDYRLKYINVVNAISAVSGMPQPDGTIVELVKKIKFTPPKKPG
jgi:biopolymer transport protein ExbD